MENLARFLTCSRDKRDRTHLRATTNFSSLSELLSVTWCRRIGLWCRAFCAVQRDSHWHGDDLFRLLVEDHPSPLNGYYDGILRRE
jgi:hypothetical protein